jgi:NADH:ubiquinone reductase (H+-translocating)
VRIGAPVTDCHCSGVSIGADRIGTRTTIWAAGVIASPAGHWLGAETDRAGRVKVGPDLSIPQHRDIFVIGDAALALGQDGTPLPGTAPVAKQQGQYLAKLLGARARGVSIPPFRYRDCGTMATRDANAPSCTSASRSAALWLGSSGASLTSTF